MRTQRLLLLNVALGVLAAAWAGAQTGKTVAAASSPPDVVAGGAVPAKAGIHAGQLQTGGEAPPVSVGGRTFGSEPAAVPRLIRFSGRLQDPAGKPLAGPVEVTFSLYAEEAGGAPLWFETQTVDSDSLGRYTALLGAMSPEGVPLELFAAGEARWLGVMVRGLPEPPRALLVSVPYALKAGDAETLGGRPASAYQLASCCGGAALARQRTDERGSPQQRSPQPSENARRESLPAAGGTGGAPSQVVGATLGYIPVMTDNTGSMGNSAIYQSGGRIGVGTTTPAYGLDLNSNIFAIGPTAPRPGAGGTMRFRDDSGTVRWAFGIPGVAGATDFFTYNLTSGQAPLYVQAGAASYSLYLSGNGNVGIGTASPAARLDVNGGLNVGQSLALGGSLNLPATAGPAAGVITLNGTPYFHACCGNHDELFVGRFAGNFTHSANSNVGVGSFALNGVTTGSGNTAAGYAALMNNGAGYGNTAVGQAALSSVTAGVNNTAVGGGALQSSTSSSGTAVGTYALYNNTGGASNAALGAYALFSNTTGGFNTALGYAAGYGGSGNGNAAGSRNTFVGTYAAPGTAAPLSNATAIGANAVVSSSNALVLGSISGMNGATAGVNVGIGTAAPAAPLHVATGDLYASQAGAGLIVKSPDGSRCARIAIDNSGALAAAPVACP